MPTLTFNKVSKSYADNKVIDSFSAEVPDKEFLVLLGPSGCGKSTMLRMIAGITDLTDGELHFDDAVVNDLTPRQRNIAFVFQSYALYPHMSVRTNIAFPLIMDRFRWWHHIPVVGGVRRKQILKEKAVAERVKEVAEMLELTPYLERRPKALSGGQRQRVALARALVRQPSLYLLDEPLSNLDAKLRTQMRAEIAALHKRVKKTFVYVTHDQVEAMTMGTRIIVLNDGIVQQYGTPSEIYNEPANEFVARFIGSPPMNLMEAHRVDGGISIDGHLLDHSPAPLVKALDEVGGSVKLGCRAEDISVSDTPGEGTIRSQVVSVEHLGAETIIGFRFGYDPELDVLGDSAAKGAHFAKVSGTKHLELGDTCEVRLDILRASWFDLTAGRRLELGA